jgi:hypothetical protein
MLNQKVLEENDIKRRKERRKESNRLAQHKRRTFQFVWVAMGF